MRYATFGSVSHGTLRNEDLLDTFAWELDYHVKRQSKRFKRRRYRNLINEAKQVLRDEQRIEEEGSELVDELQDALGDFAPPYAYFGTSEGDGSDFGFWLNHSLEEDFDGLKVNDTSEVPNDYRGEVLHVNDHGNATLYVATAPGKLRELWAVV